MVVVVVVGGVFLGAVVRVVVVCLLVCSFSLICFVVVGG